MPLDRYMHRIKKQEIVHKHAIKHIDPTPLQLDLHNSKNCRNM